MLRLLPPLCWTGLIAYLGGSQWGGAQTAAWLGPLLRALLPTASPEELAAVHLFIRKAAHVIEYAVLAGLWRRGLGGAWAPLVFAVLTALLDELRQSFTPGRVGSMVDVLLDGAAAATALGLIALRARLRGAVS
ncbi:MAG TPA: VanZ family protein [Methylomirabilota bacterium]|nr:VanZ family protein [Methylomirabilota bacterium]